MAFLSAFLQRLRTPSTPAAFTSPHTGQTFYYGKRYDAAGNMLEDTVDSSPFLAEIMLFAGNFVPRGFLACDGSLQSIAQNSALFALLGTNYGGDGQTTFAMPDLRGRIPIGAGQGPGLSNRTMAEMSGAATVAVTAANLHYTGVLSPHQKPRCGYSCNRF